MPKRACVQPGRKALEQQLIDRSFVGDMLAQPAPTIVRSIIDLGHNLTLRVVGEGVEDDEVLAAFAAAGCDTAQGFLLARPMALDALAEWLAALPGPDVGLDASISAG